MISATTVSNLEPLRLISREVMPVRARLYEKWSHIFNHSMKPDKGITKAIAASGGNMDMNTAAAEVIVGGQGLVLEYAGLDKTKDILEESTQIFLLALLLTGLSNTKLKPLKDNIHNDRV